MTYSTKELLGIINLMYITNTGGLISCKDYSGHTVFEWLNDIDILHLDPYAHYGVGFSAEEYVQTIQYAKNTASLYDLEIWETNIDNKPGGGGGFSALFVNTRYKVAIFAFRGTASGEWKDNFIGGGRTSQNDGVSTAQQENALTWYKEVYDKYHLQEYTTIVTGHSKGGNKAKYVAILDDTANLCVSFDGQGFSDEFMNKYGERILLRQEIIHNRSIDYDFVNIILNDVGQKTYYKGFHIGAGGFAENHAPNTYMNYDDSSNFSLEECDQAFEMIELDRFINSYCRSQNFKYKATSLEMFGALAQAILVFGDIEAVKEILFDQTYQKQVAYLLAYTIKYEQTIPVFREAIASILQSFNMEQALILFENILEIVNNRNFNKIFTILMFLLNIGTKFDWLLRYVQKLLEKKMKLSFSKKEVLHLVTIMNLLKEYILTIHIQKGDGDDWKVEDNPSYHALGLHILETQNDIKNKIESMKILNTEEEMDEEEFMHEMDQIYSLLTETKE
ncbi:MAG: DUF2974 domain-containing protein [Bacillota bacterium]|nr:DUF2974 domain-containing protein [Bacillota bacterium]